MNTLAITGPTSFVGRHVLSALADEPYDVLAVCRHPDATLAPHARWLALDLLDDDAVGALFAAEKPAHLLHLAWCAGSPHYRTDPANLAWARTSGVIGDAFFAHGGRRAVLAGTSAEHQAAGARSLYAESKAQAAQAMSAHARSRERRFAWGRIFVPYGPFDAAFRLVPSLIDALLGGRVARCSPGTQVRDFVHVADVANAFVRLLESERDGPVDIGTGRGVSVHGAAQEIGRQIGRPDLLRFDGPEPTGSEPRVLVAQPAELQALGWRARHIETGFAETIAWHRTRTPE
ncbi:MAG TPA: NAD(P)-dependent oxidoreductase [Candidatus Eremiobacteraceae bacterium]|nr:NAD(P)-dependent oxidoreductase [Candidatus Eremiobacteraceae bacterium]